MKNFTKRKKTIVLNKTNSSGHSVYQLKNKQIRQQKCTSKEIYEQFH